MGWLDDFKTNGEASSFLELIFNNINDAILVIDKNYLIIGINSAVEKLTGWTAEELIEKVKIYDIFSEMACCADKSCIKCFGENPGIPWIEMRIKAKDGRDFPASASYIQLSENTPSVLIFRAISEQQLIERERLTNYVIQAQEEERRRLSRELHDVVGQALYSILVGLKVISQANLDAAARNHLVNLQQLTSRALEEIKIMAVELRPAALDDLGLVAAIRSYLKRFEQTFGIESILEANGNKRRYGPAVETALYRICQEAMTNAAKYADTDKILVRLSDLDNKIELSIIDFGRGFDPDQIHVLGTGLGLYGMRERANLLGGDLEIKSESGQGTSINVTIPKSNGGNR